MHFSRRGSRFFQRSWRLRGCRSPSNWLLFLPLRKLRIFFLSPNHHPITTSTLWHCYWFSSTRYRRYLGVHFKDYVTMVTIVYTEHSFEVQKIYIWSCGFMKDLLVQFLTTAKKKPLQFRDIINTSHLHVWRRPPSPTLEAIPLYDLKHKKNHIKTQIIVMHLLSLSANFLLACLVRCSFFCFGSFCSTT